MKELATVPSKTEEVDQLLQQAKKHESTDPIRALNYGEEALKKAESIGYSKGLSDAHGLLAGLYTLHFKDKKKADHHFALYQELVSELSRKEENGILMYRSAVKLYQDDKYAEAIQYFADAHDVFLELKAHERLVTVHYTTGLMFRRLKMYDLAESHFAEAFKLYDYISEQSFKLKMVRTRARNYLDAGNYSKSKEYLDRAIELAEGMDEEKTGLGGLYNSMSYALILLQEYDKAKKYFDKGVEISQELEDYRTEGRLYHNLAYMYSKTGMKDSADHYYELALETIMPTASSFYLSQAYRDLSVFKLSNKEYAEAETYAEKGLLLMGNIEYDDKITMLETAITAETAQQKHREAFDHQQQLSLLMSSDETEKYANELSNAYESLGERLTLSNKLSELQ
ncbi:tetratricopeptide repeat protein [Roseivirga sp. BDSF3-8]|uniref:tetratricopeptide repeat protein n=1 Tax=Roseivirga sp. BDSF3-8 TaxID=3241598 RepID=UPI003531CF1B